MGNSGSVHHMQSSLKELHSYYQGQGNTGEVLEDLPYLNEEKPRSLYSLEREKSLPRSKFSRIPTSSRPFNQRHDSEGRAAAAKNAQIKVLPKLKENLRLRSTTNGAILQSGGTISGRKDSLLPQPMPVLERSKTFIAEYSSESLNESNASRVMTRRSQTQLNMDLGKRSIQNGVTRNQLPYNSAQFKRYGSNRDLSPTTTNFAVDIEPNASIYNSSESYQKLSKVKIKNKKRKAPPVPALPAAGIVQEMLAMERQTAELVHKEIERKQRLFKTKSETVLQGAYTRPPPVQPKINSMSKPRPQPSAPDMIRMSYRSKVEPISNPGFRREKSFDATLLSSRNKEAAIHPEPKTSASTIKRKSLQPSTAPSLSNHKTTDFKTERSDFKMELAAATKSRLLTSEYKLKPREPSTRQREPNNDRPKLVKLQAPARTLSKPETQSKIPQLKKTFYFGMESAKQKSVDSSQQINTNTYDEPKPKEKPTTSKDDILSTSTSSCKDNDPVYSLNEKCNSEINDNGIQVSVRPTLPRRQLEIPRFSPVAAWRTLTDEHKKQMLEPSGSSPRSSNLALEAANTFLVEDRIYRTYREPGPFYPDNKSGDSGISGDDAYLPEKPIQPRNLNEHDELMAIANLDGYPVDDQPMQVVGPFLSPWTPQQDLDEEDTSSDGDIAVKLIESPSPTSAAHVFSLSLPRENQLSVYGEKSKPDFRSLQKLKRTVSGELTGSACEYTQSSDSNIFGNVCLGNYLSDNWVLSKTGMSPNTEPSVTCRNQTGDTNKKTSYMDLSASIQPISLGCLATGKHVMYLPNRPIKELKRQSIVIPPSEMEVVLDENLSKNTRMHSKRFSFQSSVRQIERRRLAERLSKDAEKKEALRKCELEAMIRVEEEFQRKRAHEKASIRHQLRLYSMDDDNFISLPPGYSQNCNEFRAEPDGAVSSTSVSPILRPYRNNEEPGPYLAARIRNVDNEYRLNNELGMIFANS